jgi:hypothetical protein
MVAATEHGSQPLPHRCRLADKTACHLTGAAPATAGVVVRCLSRIGPTTCPCRYGDSEGLL